MAFFDSLVGSGLHNHHAVAADLFKWLNGLWNHTYSCVGNRFSSIMMPLFSPNVPWKINGYDCGAYVYHYALHLFSIKDVVITKSDVTSDNSLHHVLTKSTYVKTNPLNITEFRHP
jgi:hypothetical protein